jgi:hypothetical protein
MLLYALELSRLLLAKVDHEENSFPSKVDGAGWEETLDKRMVVQNQNNVYQVQPLLSLLFFLKILLKIINFWLKIRTVHNAS